MGLVEHPDPGPATADRLHAIEARLAELEAHQDPGGSGAPSNTFDSRIILPYSEGDPYNEVRWTDEWGNVTFQILGHGWNQDHSEFHGHGSVYVLNPTDPSGNGRGEAEVWVNAVRDPNDPPEYPYHRPKIGYNHAVLMLNDSYIAIRAESGKLFRIEVDDDGDVYASPIKDLPKPKPVTGPV